MKLFTISIDKRVYCKAADVVMAVAVLNDLLRSDMEPGQEVDVHIWREDIK